MSNNTLDKLKNLKKEILDDPENSPVKFHQEGEAPSGETSVEGRDFYLDKKMYATPGWVKDDPSLEEMPELMAHVTSEVAANNPHDQNLKSINYEDLLSTPIGFLQFGLDPDIMDTFSPTGYWEWENFQIEYIKIITWFITNKCRQGGGSAMLAAEKFAKGILSKNNYSAILTSYKKEEAVGKIDYVRQFLEALPPRFRKKIIRDPHQLIEFQNANGTRVKILSHAQKPIRGINGDVGLDELAFYMMDKEIYKSALPAVAAVRGKIDIISTPFGKSGTYYEIWSDRVKYPEFYRLPVKWWHCKRYLRDSSEEFWAEAYANAPNMTVEDRVYKYGNVWLIQQYNNADDPETFMQEFEGYFVDAQAAFFHRDLLLSCMFNEKTAIDDYNPEDVDFNIPVEEALKDEDAPIESLYLGRKTKQGKLVHFKKYKTVKQLYNAVKTGEISKGLLLGGDIGTTQHSTHICVLEELHLDDGLTIQIERFSLNKRNWDLPDQLIFFKNLLKLNIIRKAIVDATGVGMHIGQEMYNLYPSIWVNLQMGGGGYKSKMLENMMINLKNRFEKRSIALGYDKVVLEDLYKIEKVLGRDKTISFKSPKDKRHHSDAAWAVAFASFAGTPADQSHFNLHVGNVSYNAKEASLNSLLDLEGKRLPFGNVDISEKDRPLPDEVVHKRKSKNISRLAGSEIGDFLSTKGLKRPDFN